MTNPYSQQVRVQLLHARKLQGVPSDALSGQPLAPLAVVGQALELAKNALGIAHDATFGYDDPEWVFVNQQIVKAREAIDELYRRS